MGAGQTKNKDGLPLSTADMDFKSPVEIIQAIKKRADHGVFGYAYISDTYYGCNKLG